MARAPSPPIDPAADAAALLRRLGFATLMLVLPVAALVARRGSVVLVPIGLVLIILAAALDGRHRGLRDTLLRVAASPAGLAGGLLLGWCALSLLWTPFFGAASERVLGMIGIAALVVASYLALPERTRAANLYILPVGIGLAAVLAIGLALLTDGRYRDELERGLIVLVLLLWPAVAWLHSRRHDWEGLGLAALVTIAAVIGPKPLPLTALAAGALIYGITALAPTLGVRATAATLAGSVLLAPLIPLIARPIGVELWGRENPYVASLSVWRRIILDEPGRFITGHGFETAFRGRFVGLLPPNAPSTLLFEIWYDLGIIGAASAAVALYFAVTRAGRQQPTLVPAAVAAFASAFAVACLGIGTAQMWWFTAVAALVLIFVATERGQFRTTRPKASLTLRRPANDA
ncbi:MAG TPA: peptide ABC transporter permease [Beijerinckiaceae bacterium]|nr:peptide ABC transporter permease [Beijerinckiaceae bacterium]